MYAEMLTQGGGWKDAGTDSNAERHCDRGESAARTEQGTRQLHAAVIEGFNLGLVLVIILIRIDPEGVADFLSSGIEYLGADFITVPTFDRHSAV